MSIVYTDLAKSICVFVSSSDRTKDVFLEVYGHFDRMWPACPFPRYVGLTSGTMENRIDGFTVVPATRESDWARELAEQIRALPAQIEFVLLLLDDFLLLEPVRQRDIENALREAVARDFSYLRLKPPERSWLVRALRRLAAWMGSKSFYRLSPSEPYYSSLQAALWKRSHLLACLGTAQSIWHFEHIVPADVAHWTVASRVLSYNHVVEKSCWAPQAPSLFGRAGLTFKPGERRMLPPGHRLWSIWGTLKFGLIGYAWVRLKRVFSGKDPEASLSVIPERFSD